MLLIAIDSVNRRQSILKDREISVFATCTNAIARLLFCITVGNEGTLQSVVIGVTR